MKAALLSVPLALVLALWLFAVHAHADADTTKRARAFVAGHEKRIRPLDLASNEAWWQANTTGSAEAFKKKVEAQNKIDEALSDRMLFAELKGLKDNRTKIDDDVTRRA